MLAKSRGYILGGFCLMLFAGSAWAQIAAIEGDVKGPDGQLVKGAVILIERQDMKGTYKGAKTDKKGHYIYNGLPFPGTYTVSVFIDDQKRDEMKGVKTQLGDPVNISFDLKDQQKAAAPAAGAAGADDAGGGDAGPPDQGHTAAGAGLMAVEGCPGLDAVSGTLVQADGSSLVLKIPGGHRMTVRTRASSTISRQVPGSLGDVTNGAYVIVFGTTAGGRLAAKDVNIGANPLPAPAGRSI